MHNETSKPSALALLISLAILISIYSRSKNVSQVFSVLLRHTYYYILQSTSLTFLAQFFKRVTFPTSAVEHTDCAKIVTYLNIA